MAEAETLLRYRTASTATVGTSGVDLRLATAERERTEPFFTGFLTHGQQAAVALLVVARVARTRFYEPPAMLQAILAAADPVVTADGERLRFESFSACCGVAARYDVLPGGLDRPPVRAGTTNVDLNPPVRAALAEVGPHDPLHLAVGRDVTVTTGTQRHVERKVPLPSRWVRGFAEAQAAAAGLTRRVTLSPGRAHRFLQSLPPISTTGQQVLHARPGRDGLRLTAAPGPGSIPLGGAHRLRVLEPLLGSAIGLVGYGPPDGAAGTGVSVWQLDLPDGRFTVALSPTPARGFSGEGGLLWDLADESAADHARLLSTLLGVDPRIDGRRLAREAGLSEDQIRAALSHLAAAGLVGYDASEQGYFSRVLPWDPDALARQHPRLSDARALVAAGAVRLADDVAEVTSQGSVHQVRSDHGGLVCSCPWFAQHRRSRGPCKHVLAVDLARRTGPETDVATG